MTMDSDDPLPPPLRGFLTITEVDSGDFLIGDLFRRKFGGGPPDVPHHLVVLYRDRAGGLHVAGYSHMRPFGDVYLSGGSCTDGSVIARMDAGQRKALYGAGGALFLILRYAFRRYADQCDAFFGHCGNARALEVTRAAGFVPAGHQHLIVHWHKPLHEAVQRALIAKAHALGPF